VSKSQVRTHDKRERARRRNGSATRPQTSSLAQGGTCKIAPSSVGFVRHRCVSASSLPSLCLHAWCGVCGWLAGARRWAAGEGGKPAGCCCRPLTAAGCLERGEATRKRNLESKTTQMHSILLVLSIRSPFPRFPCLLRALRLFFCRLSCACPVAPKPQRQRKAAAHTHAHRAATSNQHVGKVTTHASDNGSDGAGGVNSPTPSCLALAACVSGHSL
jgi:hypothetical protein